MLNAFAHFNKITAIKSNDAEKTFLITGADIMNIYNSDGTGPIIPMGSFIQVEFAGDFGLYGRYDTIFGGTARCKISADDFYNLAFITEAEMDEAESVAEEIMAVFNTECNAYGRVFG